MNEFEVWLGVLGPNVDNDVLSSMPGEWSKKNNQYCDRLTFIINTGCLTTLLGHSLFFAFVLHSG